jgi:hypothetical protein
MPIEYSSTKAGPYRDMFARGIYPKEDYDTPCFEVCADDQNTFYPLTPNSLFFVEPCERDGGSRVSEIVTGSRLSAKTDPARTKVDTVFKDPSFYLWQQGLIGDSKKIDEDEFRVETDADGKPKILVDPYSRKNLDIFQKQQDPKSNPSAQGPSSGGSRQTTTDGTKRA